MCQFKKSMNDHLIGKNNQPLTCPECEAVILQDADYCWYCAHALKKDCPNCSTKLWFFQDVCNACGKPVNKPTTE